MIKSFHDKKTEDLFNGGRGDEKWQSFVKVARRKLVYLHQARSLHDLKAPPNNKLEALKRDRLGQHASALMISIACVLYGKTGTRRGLRSRIIIEGGRDDGC